MSRHGRFPPRRAYAPRAAAQRIDLDQSPPRHVVTSYIRMHAVSPKPLAVWLFSIWLLVLAAVLVGVGA
jgi:hypothetical protein